VCVCMYACIMGVCVCSLLRTLCGGAAWLLRSIGSCKRVLCIGVCRGGWPKLADRMAEWGNMSSCSRSAAWVIKNTLYSSLLITARE
jgi:hypothetical protein